MFIFAKNVYFVETQKFIVNFEQHVRSGLAERTVGAGMKLKGLAVRPMPSPRQRATIVPQHPIETIHNERFSRVKGLTDENDGKNFFR
ncbi:MAG: hypothetical protein P1P89_20265 [Desulfobacterales bacterium]|nr:hypothetical protein [Desulfobacterales bacterium]